MMSGAAPDRSAVSTRSGRPFETVTSILIVDAGIGGHEFLGERAGARLAPVRGPPDDVAGPGDARRRADAERDRAKKPASFSVSSFPPVVFGCRRLRSCRGRYRPRRSFVSATGSPRRPGRSERRCEPDQRLHVADRVGMARVPGRRAGELRHVVGDQHAVEALVAQDAHDLGHVDVAVVDEGLDVVRHACRARCGNGRRRALSGARNAACRRRCRLRASPGASRCRTPARWRGLGARASSRSYFCGPVHQPRRAAQGLGRRIVGMGREAHARLLGHRHDLAQEPGEALPQLRLAHRDGRGSRDARRGSACSRPCRRGSACPAPSSVRSMTTVMAPPRATGRLRQPHTPAMEKL